MLISQAVLTRVATRHLTRQSCYCLSALQFRGHIPILSYEGEPFSFLTPWGVVVESFLGKKGTMGQKIPGMADQTFDALKASQKVVVTAPPGLGLDDVWREFDDWLLKIEHSLHEHLLSNCAKYPELGTMDGRQVWETYRLVRLDVPLFESDGTLVPITSRNLSPGDFVCMQIRLAASIKPAVPGYLPKVGIAAHMGSVVRLSEPSESVNKSQSNLPTSASLGLENVTTSQPNPPLTSISPESVNVSQPNTSASGDVHSDSLSQMVAQPQVTKNQSKASAKTTLGKKSAPEMTSQPNPPVNSSVSSKSVTKTQSNASVSADISSSAQSRAIEQSPMTKNQSKPSVTSNLNIRWGSRTSKRKR